MKSKYFGNDIQREDVEESARVLGAIRKAQNWAIFNNDNHPLKKIMNHLKLNRTCEPTQLERRQFVVDSERKRDLLTKNNTADTTSPLTQSPCSPKKRPKLTPSKTSVSLQQSTNEAVHPNKLNDQSISKVRRDISTHFRPISPPADMLTNEKIIGVLDASTISPGVVSLQTADFADPQPFEYNHIAATIKRDTLINFDQINLINVVNTFVSYLHRLRGREYDIYLPQRLYQMMQFEETRTENALLLLAQPVHQGVAFTIHFFAYVCV